MPETTQVTGVIKKVTRRKDGSAIGLIVEGHDGYLDYSLPDRRGNKWDDHAEGDEVLLDVSDGKWIKAIKVLAKAEPSEEYHTLPTTDWGPKRRLDALTLAQAAVLGAQSHVAAEQEGAVVFNAADFAEEVCLIAERYLMLIDGEPVRA